MSKITKENPLIVLDAYSIIYRAYHALPDFTAPNGDPTGALYGLSLMILSIIEKFEPYAIVAAYDLPKKTFRHEVYDDYKGGRPETDEELIQQLKQSRDIMELLGIPIYDAEGFEADDIIGTIVEETKKEQVPIMIASGDMDTLQLVEGDRVQVFTLRKGIKDTTIYNVKAVEKRFGFGPKLLPDYKALRGDPSDNIIGVKGIGEKGGTQLIQIFETIDNIYSEIENEDKFLENGIKPRIIKLLKESEDDARFSKVLATIRKDAPIEWKIPEESWKENSKGEELIAKMRELGFRGLVERAKKVFGVIEEKTDSDEVEKKFELEKEKLALGVWLLNSEITNPTTEDIFNYTNTHSKKEATKKIISELQEKKLFNVWDKIEVPLIPILETIKKKGITLDLEHFSKLEKSVGKQVSELEKNIHTLAGKEFNVRSPKQLAEVLFDDLQITTKGLKKTSGGSRSTRESELEKIKDEHEIVPLILKYRELHKVYSTYIESLPKLVDENGLLHTELLQAGTSTGRFASRNPNLQNIPIRNEMGVLIRNGFIPRDGYEFVAMDYSQIELRAAAILSKDKFMTKVFVDGGDIHAAVASQVFSKDPKEVTPDERRKAKVINFGILYGMGASALSSELGVSRKEAQDFKEQYKERMPEINSYLEETIDFATKNGYTETLFGRRRYFPALRSGNTFLKNMQERMAINAPIQGTATADIIKLALIHVDRVIKDKEWEDVVFPVLQIHDEILFEVKKGYFDEVVPEIQKIMEIILSICYLEFETEIPLVVGVEKGKKWGELKH
jgi:DNA polymerase-1